MKQVSLLYSPRLCFVFLMLGGALLDFCGNYHRFTLHSIFCLGKLKKVDFSLYKHHLVFGFSSDYFFTFSILSECGPEMLLSASA